MKKISEFVAIAEKEMSAMGLGDKEPATLYAPIEYSLNAGGKKLRPALLLMTAGVYGGEKGIEDSRAAAVGIETFHNFTLLHDDVMDHSDMRRGRPTVHAKWDENTAILSGDAMLTLATEYMMEVPDEKLRGVLAAFNRMATDVYVGQRLDIDFETQSQISTDSYIEMIRLKTGALLGASARIGAMLGGAAEKDCEAMDTFGNMLGIAFQIQDDWLDTFGDSTTFGKPIGGDILNDKKTFLLVTALATTDGNREALESALKLKGEMKVRTVTRLFEKMGIKEQARKAVVYYSSKAVAALKSTSMSDSDKEGYLQLVEKLTGRRK
ncbi:MAG: polyprenyl synthetase family protein [Muribaculum sp.]|nr:polyprenyl synthetase family protein [Muribaculum sp.]